MFANLFIAFQLFAMPNDPVRAAEIQERALVENTRRHERDAKERQEFQNRQFELKFNQLVDAVAKFAKQYNHGKGSNLASTRGRKAT